MIVILVVCGNVYRVSDYTYVFIEDVDFWTPLLS